MWAAEDASLKAHSSAICARTSADDGAGRVATRLKLLVGLISEVPPCPPAILMAGSGKMAQLVRKTKTDTGGTYRTDVAGTDRRAHAKTGSRGGCHTARGDAVTKLGAIIAMLPAHELAIRRLSAVDAGFLTTCEDFEDAAAAMRLWADAGSEYTGRAQEYRDLLVELEAEILTDLATFSQHFSAVRDDASARHASSLPRHFKAKEG